MMTCPYLHLAPVSDSNIRRWCLYYWRAATCTRCPGPVGTMAYFSHSRLHLGPKPISPIEYVCLNCTLPECDETADGCLYVQARDEGTEPTPTPHCPHPACGDAITRHARTCTHHRWYK